EGHRSGVPTLGEAGALGVLAVLAELDIGTEAAGLEIDFRAGFGIGPEDAIALRGFGCLPGRAFGKLLGVAALGIVRAADEGAIAPELERKLARPAGGAEARIAPVRLGGEDVVAQKLVEGI